MTISEGPPRAPKWLLVGSARGVARTGVMWSAFAILQFLDLRPGQFWLRVLTAVFLFVWLIGTVATLIALRRHPELRRDALTYPPAAVISLRCIWAVIIGGGFVIIGDVLSVPHFAHPWGGVVVLVGLMLVAISLRGLIHRPSAR